MTPNTQMMVELVSNLGSLGFILWLAHRLTTQTFPRLAQENNEAQATARKENNEAQAVTRKDFKESLALQRDDFRREMDREREIHGQQTSRIIDAIERAAG